MQSRMDKYQTEPTRKYERSKKNTKLYEDVYDDIYRDTTYTNMEVIDSAKEINLNKLKNMLDDKYDTRQYRTLKNYSIEDIDIDIDNKPTFDKKRQRVHDINEIINEAKSKRAFIEEAKEKQKYMEFTESRNKKYDSRYDEIEKEEQELEELINTMAIPKQDSETSDALDIFSDLKGSDNTITTKPIDASFDYDTTKVSEKTKTEDIRNDLEKTLIKADKNFYTDSNMFTKNDFEDFSTLTKHLKKTNKTKTIFITLIVLAILGVAAYFIVTNYIIK